MEFSPRHRAAILRAARDAQTVDPNWRERYDVVDLATDTGNYWWQGLSDRAARIGLRLIHMQLMRRTR